MDNETSWYRLQSLTPPSEGRPITAEILVPAESPWFCGHFPGDPILPAIAQLSMVLDIANHFNQIKLVSMKRVRFRRIIRPNERLHITLEAAKEPLPRSCSFKITVNEEIASSGFFIIEEKTDYDNRQ